MFVGLRIVRGPDWSSGESDGGEGHVGTVATIEGAGAVDVIWDSGQRSTCRAGKDGRHDLRVFDSGTVGIRHRGLTCCGCDARDFFGTRWQCTSCKDVDLCGNCYSNDKHNIRHVFARIDTPGEAGVKVSKRSASLKIQSLGLYPGARVVRGEDWRWGQQDGGPGSKGTVTEIAAEENVSTTRNILRVKWDCGRSNVYRVAHEGKMDLKYTEEAPGPSYYRDHMLILDVSTLKGAMTSDPGLVPGCQICIKVDNDELKRIQMDKGEWTDGMSACIGKRGTLNNFPSSDVACVEFGDIQYRIAKDVLLKVHEHSVQDVVRVLSDKKTVSMLQQGHGGWNDNMSKSLGKVGRVMKVDSKGDVLVMFGSTKWFFNAACCIPAKGERIDDVPLISGSGSDLGGLAGQMMELFAGLLDPDILQKVAGGLSAPSDQAGQIFRAIKSGDTEAVKSILKADPRKKNELHKGLSTLIVACHQGHVEIVKVLLDYGVDLEYKSDEGVNALAISIMRQKELIASLLMEGGVDVNVALNDGQTFLHLAVQKNMHRILKLLIRKGCDVNRTDSCKDTALHDAIRVNGNECVEVFLEVESLNLRQCNQRGFNPLHFANLRGNVFAVEKILERDRSLVDLLMSDNTFCALHIAAKNDHVECARLLIDKGKATVDRKGHLGQTPLHIAMTGPNMRTAELLLEKGANINHTNEIGDTALHILFVHCSKKNREQTQLSQQDVEKYLQLAIFLLKKNAAYNMKNRLGIRPLQLCESERIKQGVQKFIDQNKGSLNSEAGQSSPQEIQTRADGQNMMSTLDMALPCCKCYSAISDVTLKPCNHKVVCSSCAGSFTKCPMCDSPIQGRAGEPECTLQ